MVKNYWIELSKEEKDTRKKELIGLCKTVPEIMGTDYADLEEEYLNLLRRYKNLLDLFKEVIVSY